MFEHKPRKLQDVGGNAGKWTIHCANHSNAVSVTNLDLSNVVAAAGMQVEEVTGNLGICSSLIPCAKE